MPHEATAYGSLQKGAATASHDLREPVSRGSRIRPKYLLQHGASTTLYRLRRDEIRPLPPAFSRSVSASIENALAAVPVRTPDTLNGSSLSRNGRSTVSSRIHRSLRVQSHNACCFPHKLCNTGQSMDARGQLLGDIGPMTLAGSGRSDTITAGLNGP